MKKIVKLDHFGALLAWMLLAKARGNVTMAYSDPKSKRVGFDDIGEGTRYVVPLKAVKEASTWLPAEVYERLRDDLGRGFLFGRDVPRPAGWGSDLPVESLGPDGVPEILTTYPLRGAALADAFALVETHDILVSCVRAHPDDWPNEPDDPLSIFSESTVWGASLEVTNEAERGVIEFLIDDGAVRARVRFRVVETPDKMS